MTMANLNVLGIFKNKAVGKSHQSVTFKELRTVGKYQRFRTFKYGLKCINANQLTEYRTKFSIISGRFLRIFPQAEFFDVCNIKVKCFEQMYF